MIACSYSVLHECLIFTTAEEQPTVQEKTGLRAPLNTKTAIQSVSPNNTNKTKPRGYIASPTTGRRIMTQVESGKENDKPEFECHFFFGLLLFVNEKDSQTNIRGSMIGGSLLQQLVDF